VIAPIGDLNMFYKSSEKTHTSFTSIHDFHSYCYMCIPSHSFKTLLIRTIKLSSAFLKKQRLKNSNVLLSRFKASRNTLKFCLLCSDKRFKLNAKLRQHRYTEAKHTQ
jgi:hypothetical protein